MSAARQLVVVKNGKIAFTPYLVKHNHILMKLNLLDMIGAENSDLVIPMQTNTVAQLYLYETGRGERVKVRPNFPHCVDINSWGDILQINDFHGKMDAIIYKGARESWWARASLWPMEMAATAGCIIYDDVGKIFEEAYYSCGLTPPPYYVGEVKQIADALSLFDTMLRIKVLEHQEPESKGLLSPWDDKKRPNVTEYYKDRDRHQADIAYAVKYKLLYDIKLPIAVLMELKLHNDLGEPATVFETLTETVMLKRQLEQIKKKSAKKPTAKPKRAKRR
jgi:hypothetical protein